MSQAFTSLRQHWPEYLMEAWGLGMFMIAAGSVWTILVYPGSPVAQAVTDPLLRLSLMGMAMGLTSMGIIYSPSTRTATRPRSMLDPLPLALRFHAYGTAETWLVLALSFPG